MGRGWQDRRDSRDRSRSPTFSSSSSDEDDSPPCMRPPRAVSLAERGTCAAAVPTAESREAFKTFQLVFNRFTCNAGMQTVLPQPFADSLRELVYEHEQTAAQQSKVVVFALDEWRGKSRFPIMRRVFGSLLSR